MTTMNITAIPTSDTERLQTHARATSALRELTKMPERAPAAAAALVMLGDESAFDAFLDEAWGDKHAFARAYVTAIGRCAGPMVFTLLRHKSDNVRWYAITEVGNASDKTSATNALWGYFKALRLGDRRHRLYCAIVLAQLGDRRGLRYLRAWMVSTGMEDEYDSRNAMEMLARDASPAGCRTLLNILLRQGGPALYANTFDIDDVGRHAYNLEAALILRHRGATQEACRLLILVIQDTPTELSDDCTTCAGTPDGLSQGWENAVELLGFLGDPHAIPTLLAALPKSPGRVERALARISTPELDPLLLRLLRSFDRETRLAAMLSLGRRGDCRALEVLLNTLRKEADPKNRKALIDTLRCYAWQDLRCPLRAMSRSTQGTAARNAIQALAALKGESERSLYVESLQHPSALAQLAAVHAIAQFGEDEGSAALIAILSEPPSAKSDRRSMANLRCAVLDALAYLRITAARPLVLAALDDPHRDVRAAAARACLHYARMTDASRLRPFLFDEDPTVTRIIAATLRHLGDFSATDELISLLLNQYAGPASMRAIETLGLLHAA